jgi:hypothetical protein
MKKYLTLRESMNVVNEGMMDSILPKGVKAAITVLSVMGAATEAQADAYVDSGFAKNIPLQRATKDYQQQVSNALGRQFKMNIPLNVLNAPKDGIAERGEGTVRIGFVIGPDGRATQMHVISSSHWRPEFANYCRNIVANMQAPAPPTENYEVVVANCDFYGKNGMAKKPPPQNLETNYDGKMAEEIGYLMNNFWEYPPDALEQGLEGSVTKQFHVVNGLVVGYRAVGKTNPVFEKAFREMFRQASERFEWSATPIESEVNPVSTNVWIPVTVEWKLNPS